MIGRPLAHYRITAALGAGGMGEVYRATDTKLGREVALKVLPVEMARDAERLARFQREARAIAALNHPNIVTIFSVEETDGIHFLTMELVEGQSLDRMIPEAGLAVEQIVEIAGALAAALSAAHEKGIIHRDLKPSNVMVTDDGRVKVLDFGLAKETRPATHGEATVTSAHQTQAGVVMGTPAYMSPEQVSGRILDNRSDLFSLGGVLHEMATGKRPFEGTSSAELVSAILRDSPLAVTEIRPDLPADLARVIRRCLEKDPRYRMQTARDVGNEFRDLARLASGPSRVTTPTSHAVAKPDSGAARADEGFWIAVLPFKYTGSNQDLASLADGLTDDVVTGMSKFSYLRVLARGSTARYAQQSVDLRVAAKELGARYVMEGSIRQAGAKVRIAVHLIDASTGAGLWAETYDRPFTPESTLELLDDVVPRIVATVGDAQGVLAHAMTDSLRNRDPESLTPYEAVLRSFGYHQLVTLAEHQAGIKALERAVKQAPDRADCWAMLAWLIRGEFTHNFNPRPDPLGRSLAAAQRAIEAEPANAIAHAALASALFCQRDFPAFRTAAQRALALNRLEGYATAYLGLQIAYAGDWEQGCALAERATQLNPNHPGWYWLPLAVNAYREKQGQRALEYALKVNMPGLWTAQFTLAVIFSQLGQKDQARSALREVLALRPDFARTAREELEKWWQPDMVEQMLGDLRKAGFNAPDASVAPHPSSGSTPVRTASGENRVDEGFWVAVLPFKHKGTDPNLESLAEGLVEEIITGFSRFSYMRVISRGSSSTYGSESADVRKVGKELGARYVLEGNLRQADTRLRVTVQLLDTSTGAHLWAETYNRIFQPNAIFDLQDELVPKIVSTVADAQGVLPRNMGESLRSRKAADLTPYEAVLRSFAYLQRISPEEHRAAREALELAVERAPDYAPAWAMLSIMFREEFAQGFNLGPSPLERADSAARRAIEIAPSDNLGFHALASAQFLRREYSAFRTSAERALAVNPMDGFTVAYIGFMLAYAGDWERGCALSQQARSLNPHHPGWFWFADAFNSFRQGNYREALGVVAKINMPNFWRTNLLLAASFGHLGDLEAARSAVRALLAIKPDFAAIARAECEKWWQPALVDQILDGLRAAGLEFPEGTTKPGASPALSGLGTAPPPARSTVALQSGSARLAEGFWMAVLPFKPAGSNPELKALADGLTEEIITGLSRFSYLRVIARGSTLRYADQLSDLRMVGKELGARYVMEGSLRQAGSSCRLAVQLVDAVTGAHLWAETFDRPFRPEEIFGLQDQLVPRIVSTVADQHGVLVHSMINLIRNKRDEDLTPLESVLRVFSFHERMTPEEHSKLRAILERAVEQTPDESDCWSMLATLYSDEHMFGFSGEPDPLGRAQVAARRGLEIAPSSPLASQALAQSLFFRREWQAFRPVAERTISLNPMDGATMAFIGLLLALSGDWERGCGVAEAARQLNPHFPGWYWLASVFHAYHKRDYRASAELALRINMPGYFWGPATSAAAWGQLGEQQAAQKAVQELVAIRPDFAATARAEFAKWFDQGLAEHYVEGLSKAGLKMASFDGETVSAPFSPLSTATQVSGEIRAEEGFWVAVLPFKFTDTGPELKALADGLNEGIVTGLSRFSYLRVISRGSAAKHSSESGDVRSIRKELGARYVLEGSLRQAGSKLRLAVQLVDAVSGSHLWAETYERAFSPDSIFELQDDLVPRIVSTVADMNGVLTRSMSESVRSRDPEQLSPYEAVLRSFGYGTRATAEELSASIEALEMAVRKAPAYGEAWGALAQLYGQDYAQGFKLHADSLERALNAAQRAVELAPTNYLGYCSLAQALFFQKEFQSFRNAAERAVALNPMDGNSVAFLGELLTYTGDSERGLALAGRAKQLNPANPGWYWYTDFYDAYRKSDYRGALNFALKVNMPGHWFCHAAMAAAYGQLGEVQSGAKAARELLRVRPNFAATARKDIEKWWDPEYRERLIKGWRKAGLEIADEPAKNLKPATTSVTGSGATRAEEGFWLAVLPFKAAGMGQELKALADGLAEGIVTGLSRFSYLRVIAHGSTLRYADQHADLRVVGNELGARYVMDGTFRQAGSKLRVSVQLVDATSGAHLWAETYERAFGPEAVFELQDDLVPRIVSTVADWYGVLPHSMSEAVRAKGSEQLTPYEAVLRSFGYYERVNPQEHAVVRGGLERAVQHAPGNADAWSMLAMIYGEEFRFRFNVQPDSLERSLRAAKRAVDAAPSSHSAYLALAQAFFFRKEFGDFHSAAEQALALNPMDGATCQYLAHLLAFSGDWERGCDVAARSRELNPHHPVWYWALPLLDAYHKGNYQTARTFAMKVNIQGLWLTKAIITAVHGQLGDSDAARKSREEMLALAPESAVMARDELSKWYPADLVESLMEGLRKAGLKISEKEK